MVCVIPFILLIFSKYLGETYFCQDLFNPFYIFKVIKRTILRVFVLSVQTTILAAIVFLILYKIFILHLQFSDTAITTIRLGLICLFFYFGFNINLIYILGLADIAQKYLKN
jgi:hypothetical protein